MGVFVFVVLKHNNGETISQVDFKYGSLLNYFEFPVLFPNSETLQNVLSLLLWGLSQEVNYVSGCVILLSFLFWMDG